MQQRMTALKALRYAGKSLKPGDRFSADPRHVRVLVTGKMAVIAAEPVARKPVSSSLPKTAAPEPELRIPVAVRPGLTLSETFAQEDAEAKQKRTYTRRDMKAES